MGNIQDFVGSSNPTLKEIIQGFLEEEASVLRPVAEEANNPGEGGKEKRVTKAVQWRR